MDKFQKKLFGARIVPVIVIDNANDAVPLARILCDNKIETAEITLRTDAAIEAIKRIAKEVPDILVGAGTVSSIDQAEKAISAGASYIVMAGFRADVVNWCVQRQIPVFPGVTTPTEIMMALEFGLKDLKFFPAEQSGGVAKLKAFNSPFSEISFMPTGGITKNNILDYLSLSNVKACGGSWICPRDMILKGEFEQIDHLCKEAVKQINGK